MTEVMYDKALQVALEPAKVVVAVIDNGVDYNHPFLAYKISRAEPGFNFADNDNRPFPIDFADPIRNHGTHVAGIIARDNDGVAIVAIRRADLDGLANPADFSAVEYAAKRGARIVNMSFGDSTIQAGFEGFEDWDPLRRAIESHPEILFVASAGNAHDGVPNNNDRRPLPPASFNFPNLIVVGAVDKFNRIAAESNYGKLSVDIGALGVDVRSAAVGGGEVEMSGTSMAAPQVSRVASEVLAINPSLTPPQVIQLIKSTARQVPALKDKFSTGGVLDEAAALASAKNEPDQRDNHPKSRKAVKAPLGIKG